MMDPDQVRRVYMADGTDGQVGMDENLGSRTVAYIRDGILHPELTLGLVPGIRPRKPCPETNMSPEEMQDRVLNFYAYRRWISRSTPSFKREVSV
jgi:uncharacterized protein (DUF2252 family)